MRKYPDKQIIEKAFQKIAAHLQENQDVIDIAVDFDDEHDLTHSYVVTFKKDAHLQWIPLEINEISAW